MAPAATLQRNRDFRHPQDTNNAGLTRSFTRFSDAIDEIIDARVWSGIHFRNADEQGARIGRQVAKWREQHDFRPVHP